MIVRIVEIREIDIIQNCIILKRGYTNEKSNVFYYNNLYAYDRINGL